ncbi:hypothetical protein CPB84DRAFT_1752311 [Gymnopilus junonius]|uniref:Uncharacterized protein n=1 Tax=Gymnopilus junonius TaxID=109634 RepID=A0A9P5TG49_GYMJU|nr:hypothetical protein CPB84DRAFT_1752311 [Gymnopilus junonius]
MPALLLPTSTQEIVFNTVFNTLLLEFLLFGIYTVVYAGTLYVYWTKAPSQRHWMIICAISVSYLVCLIQVACQWYFDKRDILNIEVLQGTLVSALHNSPRWLTLLNQICYFIAAALADGLLIWRCFNVWSSSIRVILLPSFFLLCEIASAANLDPSPSQSETLNALVGTTLLMTVATTLVTTSLIAYRMHFFAKENVFDDTRSLLKYIVEVMVQSATVYSLATIPFATVSIIHTETHAPVLVARYYTAAFYLFTAGIAPTIMVARVALISEVSQVKVAMSSVSSMEFCRPTTGNVDSVLYQKPENSQIKECQEWLTQSGHL